MAKSKSNVGAYCVVLLLVVVIIVVVFCINQNTSKNKVRGFTENDHNASALDNNLPSDIQENLDVQTGNMNNSQVLGGQNQGALNNDPNAKARRQAGCFPKDQLTPHELLPQDTANAWAKSNPDGGGTLKDKNFLQSAHHIGVNTVGQTLRNANLQLRSEPPNPQVKVSPWAQSTIEPDMNRKPMEIGGCA
jgi:hypothetical protein